MRPLALAASLLLIGCAHAPSGVASKESIQWIHDDYAGALAQAKDQGKPLFVDIWATWCHSCLSMQRYVFADPGMRGAKDAAIYVAIDQELPRNRAFVTRFPVEGLPTFLLLDPRDESVAARWLGSGTVADLRGFIEQGALSMGGDAGSPRQLARAGDKAQLQGDYVGASVAYEQAVARSDLGDRFRPQLLNKLVSALGHLGTPEVAEKCTVLGDAEMERTGNTSLAADFAAGIVQCSALALRAAELRTRAEVRLQRLIDDKAAPLSADDRSDALGSLVSMLDEEGRRDEALAASQQRKALLLAAQQAAPDADTASTFDGHLTETYLRLGELPAAEALLALREKELPRDFNPPARLARVLLEEKKLEGAEAAADRALRLMPEGPRRAGILGLKARILAAEGKPARDTLGEELQLLRSLPPSQRRPKREAEIAAQLDKR